MGVIINYNKLVIITEPKTIHFSFSKKIDNFLKHEINLMRDRNGTL